MKTFTEYLSELKLHRGHKLTHTVKGSAPLVWLAMDKKYADSYTEYHASSTVSSLEFHPENSVDVGKAKRRLTITDFMDEIIEKAHKALIDMKSLDSVSKRLLKKFGNVAINLDQFWYDSDDFALFLEICGFDSLITIEDGYQTIGIIRKHLK